MIHFPSRPRWFPWGGLLGLLASLIPFISGRDSSADAPLPVPAAEHQERCEFFVIDWIAEAPHPASDYQGIRGLERAVQKGEVGLAEFRRRFINGGWQLEQDVAFPFESVRLMAVECLSPKSPHLVWRELTPSGGRTLFAEWNADGDQLRVMQWEQDGSLRETLDAHRGMLMPHSLLEMVRNGEVSQGNFGVFNPLSGQFERWTLELRRIPRSDWSGSLVDQDRSLPLREAQLRRSDGSLARRYRFAGTRLVELEWQAGALRLRSISAQAYAARHQAWGLEDSRERETPAVKEM